MGHSSFAEFVRGVCASTVTALLAFAFPVVAIAGPPFLTDDPVPVDLGHFETYVFSQWDNSPGTASNVTGPAVEFNWGFLPNLQFHVVAPFENATVPGMPNAFGFGDTEIGVKYRFVQESAGRPQVGFFPMAEVATGDASRNLGNGQTWYRLPLWFQKSYDDQAEFLLWLRTDPNFETERHDPRFQALIKKIGV